jgi:hypothetical protein
MKKIIITPAVVIIQLISILCLNYSCTSSKEVSSPITKGAIIQAINSDQWNFDAHYVMPAFGRSRDIRGSYSVKCSKDTLTVVLPYFGKMNSPGSIDNQNPLDFRSTDFSLKKEEKKSGMWEVTIKPNDFREVQSMDFTFYDNGTARLNIVLLNRSAISFTGNVVPKK